ncbi:MAG: hypothetical protein RL322_1428 [Pseudomonadota bacterium]
MKPAALPSHPSPAASPWRRLMGITYESIILFGVIWFADYAFSALTQFKGEPGPLRHAFQAFTVLVLGSYFSFFWSDGRVSLPMKTLSLAVQTREGRPPGPLRAALRFGAALALPVAALAGGHLLSGWLYLLVPISWVWCMLDRDAQALHDRIAGTRLVNQTPPDRIRSVDV